PATAPLSAAQPASKPIAAAEPILPVPKRWPLPPVDESMPEIRAGVTCSLPLVLTGVSKHVQSLVKNLEQITATESIEAVESDALGNRRLTDPRRYYYVVAISEVRAGTLTVDEYRKPVSAQQPPPRGIETHGLFALPLLFHPFYSKDFEFRCEGLTQWHGQPAWSVYFQQRKDRPSRIRAYSLRNGRFPVKLKGRVWIAQNSYEILRLEANMLEPVKEIQLQHEHLVIEYQPMEFATRKDKLWLPTTAEYFAHFRDRVYHFRHSLSDYLVFNVNFGEKQKAPKPIEVPPENPPDKPLR
ncbi:MAG TPA: hypothetical protein VNL38_00830, partial [Candidatus Nitrosotenuis sp.]|nr:hypothetical protein [Candidatus Nitrosotenuis sp.]